VRLNVGDQMHSKESRRFVGLPLPVAACLFHSAPRKRIETGQLDNMQDNVCGERGQNLWRKTGLLCISRPEW